MSGQKASLALVVEDDEPIRELVADTLWDEGYSILEAQDGQQAIQLLDEVILPADVPCVILLDLMLPRVSGLDVLDHLKARGSKLPVVAMSANLPALATARAAGTQATVAKPFDLIHLVAVVECYADPIDTHG
ncbi:MAG TPA: response regulator [Chloroflexota bacterium]|jgi:CheY-like chemotaxis protein